MEFFKVYLNNVIALFGPWRNFKSISAAKLLIVFLRSAVGLKTNLNPNVCSEYTFRQIFLPYEIDLACVFKLVEISSNISSISQTISSSLKQKNKAATSNSQWTPQFYCNHYYEIRHEYQKLVMTNVMIYNHRVQDMICKMKYLQKYIMHE